MEGKLLIEVKNITKIFDGLTALKDVSVTIGSGSIFGLVGSNGSGKSTLLRLIANIFTPDRGNILLDSVDVRDNPKAKARLFYLSDDPFFFSHSNVRENAAYLSAVYPRFDRKRTEELCGVFGLSSTRKITTFSKGMQKQAAVILALSAHPDVLLCDETFDGLDPVMRQLVKKLVAAEVVERGMTAVIASHNLRELEDICDHLALLHQTGLLFESEIDTLKENVHTVQAAFSELPEQLSCEGLKFINVQTRGSLLSAVVRGEEAAVRRYLDSLHPIYCELITLTLEEIFLTEMEERGYDAKHLIG